MNLRTEIEELRTDAILKNREWLCRLLGIKNLEKLSPEEQLAALLQQALFSGYPIQNPCVKFVNMAKAGLFDAVDDETYKKCLYAARHEGEAWRKQREARPFDVLREAVSICEEGIDTTMPEDICPEIFAEYKEPYFEA